MTPEPRALRVLFVANDGLGAGHVTRAIAVARALPAEAARRGITVERLLSTTSSAERLLSSEPMASVRLPSPARGLGSSVAGPALLRLCERLLAAMVEQFAPDVLVVDTFPSGPHFELASLLAQIPCRVLIRRTVRADREAEPEVTAGLGRFGMVIVPDDPTPQPASLPCVRRVPPIVLGEPDAPLDRAAARAALGLPDRPLALVLSGGGGDPDAREAAERIAAHIQAARPDLTPVIADGPLSPPGAARPVRRTGALRIAVAPLAPYLRAFDLAFAAAGYNSAHELARAGLRAALYACPRPFDDQGARARRFDAAGLAVHLPDEGARAVSEALARLEHLAAPRLVAGGAGRAAAAVLDAATGRS